MKSKTKNLQADRLLTDTELELMSILWKLGEGTVSEVINQLPKNRDLAYTSVSTILRILEQKKVLTARKEGRGHVYIPALKKDKYETRTLKHVVEKVFDGTPIQMVRQLLSTVDLSEQELLELKILIQQKGKEK